jgi:hypothetical protein
VSRQWFPSTPRCRHGLPAISLSCAPRQAAAPRPSRVRPCPTGGTTGPAHSILATLVLLRCPRTADLEPPWAIVPPVSALAGEPLSAQDFRDSEARQGRGIHQSCCQLDPEVHQGPVALYLSISLPRSNCRECRHRLQWASRRFRGPRSARVLTCSILRTFTPRSRRSTPADTNSRTSPRPLPAFACHAGMAHSRTSEGGVPGIPV